MAVEPGKMVLTVRNMEAGQGVEELEIDYGGDNIDIALARVPGEGLHPVRTLVAAGVLFGLATVAHGSGFLNAA